MTEEQRPAPEPELAEVLPGLHYASVRHAADLGPSPCPQTDSDWGVKEGFNIPAREARKSLSLEELDKQFKNSFSENAPSIVDLKDGLIMKCRQAHADDIARRRACPKRKKIEDEMRRRAEDV